VLAQTFSSGSTGADGVFNPVAGTTNITVRPGGVYNYTTVNIPSTATLRYLRSNDNAPVVILASGDVTISGTIELSGFPGGGAGTGATGPAPGGPGGPGGFNGGFSGFVSTNPPLTVLPTAGQGPGGGAAAVGVNGAGSGTYAAPTSFVALTPLFGGSGGGGGANGTSGGGAGTGSGGGGAILIASSTRIIVNGTIRANGAAASTNFNIGCIFQPGAGAGGAIRLVAPEISGSGILQALRGLMPANCGQPQATDGRIRVEAFTTSGFTGVASPTASVANAPGGASPAGNPALANVPTLQIASIGGLAVPTTPNASYSVPDLTLAAGTANPVPVVLNATNTPVGAPTVITVRLIPQGNASSVAVPSLNHTGTFASSTATASVTLTVGQVTVLQAHAAMTLTGQTASLFPLIDGEPVERVMLAALPGEASTLSLVTRSGKERRLEELRLEDQIRVAQAWETMRGIRTE
jgi:hypothetical protein